MKFKLNSIRGGSILELSVGMVLMIISSVGFISYMSAQVKTQMYLQLNIGNSAVLSLEEDRARNFDIEDYKSIGGSGIIVHKLRGLTEDDDRFFSMIRFDLESEDSLIEANTGYLIRLTAEVMEKRNGNYYGLEKEIIHETIIIRN
jgi:hypothetical protein